MAARTQVNSATGIMGVTGAGKSALLATLARYVWERWHKVTRYYNSDGGGFPAAIQELQALGIMEVFRMRTRDTGDLRLSFETAYRSYSGYWPRLINPSTGEVPPGVEMIPPIAYGFELYCHNGHLTKTVATQSLLTPGPCPTCRELTTPQTWKVVKTSVQNKGFEHVGAVCYDGLTSVLAWELSELGQRAGAMELKGEEAALGGKVASGDMRFGGTTRSHVGFVQSRGEELVHLTLAIPNLVVPPVITMLTHEDVDDRGLNITGPKISGRAKTDEAPQWFGNLLEVAKVPALNGGNGEQRVLYLKEFTDAYGRRHLCKIRGNPGTMPAYLADPPGGDEDASLAFTQFNLGLFYRMLDEALEQSIGRAKQQFPDAPGLKEGWVEIGSRPVSPITPAAPVVGPASAPLRPTSPPAGLLPGNEPTAPAPPTATAAPPAPPAPAAPTATKSRTRKPPLAAPPPAVPMVPPAAAPSPATLPPTSVTPAGSAADVPLPLEPAPVVPAAPVPPTPMAPAAGVSGQAPVPPGPPPAPAGPRLAPPPGRRPTPPGVSVNGPGAPITPRPTSAAPRPPAAVPRPPSSVSPPPTPGVVGPRSAPIGPPVAPGDATH